MTRDEAKAKLFDAVVHISKAADTLRLVEKDVVCQSNLPVEAMASLNSTVNLLNETATGLDLRFGLV